VICAYQGFVEVHRVVAKLIRSWYTSTRILYLLVGFKIVLLPAISILSKLNNRIIRDYARSPIGVLELAGNQIKKYFS